MRSNWWKWLQEVRMCMIECFPQGSGSLEWLEQFQTQSRDSTKPSWGPRSLWCRCCSRKVTTPPFLFGGNWRRKFLDCQFRHDWTFCHSARDTESELAGWCWGFSWHCWKEKLWTEMPWQLAALHQCNCWRKFSACSVCLSWRADHCQRKLSWECLGRAEGHSQALAQSEDCSWFL